MGEMLTDADIRRLERLADRDEEWDDAIAAYVAAIKTV